jgi:uncharacterized protein (TIGR00299 family) protein
MSFPSSADASALPPPRSLAIHLDLVGGLAGDMFVAAMTDAIPGLRARVLDELACVRPDGAPLPVFADATAAGFRARRFGLATAAKADTDNDHGTSYSALRRRIAEAPIDSGTRAHALALLALLGEAEASVHGVAIGDVHFHELADWDSLLDVVAAGAIAAALDGARWSASALPLGGGDAATAHGRLPVPAPATAWLMTGYPWRDDGVPGERVTPTGAAILRHLVPPSRCGTRRDDGRLLAIGHGAGTRSLAGIPNLTRAMVIDVAVEPETDAIVVLEFDVDDMTGEEIALAADRLRGAAGVVDVSVGTRTGKKGRPLADFRLLVQPHAAEAVANACFIETSTLGLRVRDERRRILRRADVAASVGTASLSVKLAQRPDGDRTAKAAHDDVAHERGLAGRRRARAAGEQRALESDE